MIITILRLCLISLISTLNRLILKINVLVIRLSSLSIYKESILDLGFYKSLLFLSFFETNSLKLKNLSKTKEKN